MKNFVQVHFLYNNMVRVGFYSAENMLETVEHYDFSEIKLNLDVMKWIRDGILPTR